MSRKPKAVVLGKGVHRRSGKPIELDEFYVSTELRMNVFSRDYLPEGESGTLLWLPDPPKPKPSRRRDK